MGRKEGMKIVWWEGRRNEDSMEGRRDKGSMLGRKVGGRKDEGRNERSMVGRKEGTKVVCLEGRNEGSMVGMKEEGRKNEGSMVGRKDEGRNECSMCWELGGRMEGRFRLLLDDNVTIQLNEDTTFLAFLASFHLGFNITFY